MGFKTIILILIAPLLLGALLVFDAANRTEYAIDVADAAQAAPPGAQQAEMLASIEEQIAPGLERAALWHAGAAEARSGLAVARAQAENNPELLSPGAEWGARAVQLSPVLPNAWARLAAMRAGGLAAPCEEKVCLDRSWLTGPMLGGGTGCARLRLAQARGWLAADDPRITQYALSGAGAAEVARCLQFLGPDAVFKALLERQQSQAR